MSRTYRRKTIKPSYYNFTSKEDFEVSKHHFDLGAQPPKHHRPFPTRPLIQVRTGWLNRMEWVEADYRHWRHPQYVKYQQKTREWYKEFRQLDAHANYLAADDYRRYGNGAKTYEQHKAQTEARHHSDNGHEVHGRTIPRWFRLAFSECPQRTEARDLIRKGMNGEDWEDIVFPDKPIDVGWFYW